MATKYAVLSVSDKEGIVEFARALCSLDYIILSTGGTRKILQEYNIESIEVSDYTESQEMFDGRVKTLHPKIHGGILYRRDNEYDVKQEQSLHHEILENIDIGGPSLIRAAAKNFQNVIVVVDSKDYGLIIESLKNGVDTSLLRQQLMIKAFSHTARYDGIIANYMNERFCGGMGEHVFLMGKKVMDTNYGENPHQKGALYEFENLALSTNPDKKIETELNDIMEVIEESKMINNIETKEKFWDMFVIDSLIGNTDRHNGNWGFLLNKTTGKVSFSPIYDCGSCLNPMLEDEEIENMSQIELKNLAINCYSCIKENGKKINYMSYIRQMQNEECNNAIKRLFSNINIEEINKFIDNIECISNIRKDFYKNIIEQRYEIIRIVIAKILTLT